jgi:single-strand DNA-binding protein
MPNFNQATIIGHLGRDPEVKQVGGGKVAKFSVATSEKWTDKNGERRERTDWHNVEVWGRTAEVAEKFLAKGSAVLVQGPIRYDKYEDRDGIKRTSVKVDVQGPGSRLVLMGRKGDGDGNGNSESNRGGGAPTAPDGWGGGAGGSRDDDDIPF